MTLQQIDQTYLKKNTKNWWTGIYQDKLLILGIMLIGFGFHQLPTIYASKSSLIQIKGTLRAADIYVTNVTDRRGHESRKSELVFYINGRKQRFYFAENIGDNYRNEKYESILKGLKRADTITVWVRKSEIDKYEPKVFQIDSKKSTLLDFKTIRTDKGPLTAFLFLLGFCSIALSLRLRFPEKFDKIYGKIL